MPLQKLFAGLKFTFLRGKFGLILQCSAQPSHEQHVMRLQNQADPRGQLHAVSARGLFMGNRGRLHNGQQQVVKQWKVRPWIICALSFKGIKRELMLGAASFLNQGAGTA